MGKQNMCPLPEIGCAHAGSYFVLSMLDRLWHPDLTQDEALELMEKGIEEVCWQFRHLACPFLQGTSSPLQHAEQAWSLRKVGMCFQKSAHAVFA